MKRFALALLALCGLVGAGIWFLATRPIATPVPAPLATSRAPSAPQEITFVAPPPSVRKADPAPTPAPEPAPPPPALIADPELATQRIHALATTFDAAHARELSGYLQHPSREVRQNAAKGLMLLGDASTVDALKTAAKLAEAEKDAEMVSAYQAAADFLSTPRPDEALPPPTPLHLTEQSTAEMWREKARKPASPPLPAQPPAPTDQG